MKSVLIAGDTLDNIYTISDYPATDGWALTLALLPETAGVGTAIRLTAVAQGDEYRLQVPSTVSAQWTPAKYTLRPWIESNGIRYGCDPKPDLPTVVTVLPDPATATFFDGRSRAQRDLDAINAVLSGSATRAQKEYEIAGRRLQYFSPAELIVLADRAKREVAAENRAARIAAGLGNPRNVGIRFGMR